MAGIIHPSSFFFMSNKVISAPLASADEFTIHRPVRARFFGEYVCDYIITVGMQISINEVAVTKKNL